MSQRYKLIQALVAAFEEIKETNDYSKDIRKVYSLRSTFSDTEKDYFIVINEEDDQEKTSKDKPGMEVQDIPFIIQGMVKESAQGSRESAYKLLADMKKVINKEKISRFDTTVMKVMTTPGAVSQPEGASTQWLYVILRLTITITEKYKL